MTGTWEKNHIEISLPQGITEVHIETKGIDGVHTLEFTDFECVGSFVPWKDYDYNVTSSEFLLFREYYQQGKDLPVENDYPYPRKGRISKYFNPTRPMFLARGRKLFRARSYSPREVRDPVSGGLSRPTDNPQVGTSSGTPTRTVPVSVPLPLRTRRASSLQPRMGIQSPIYRRSSSSVPPRESSPIASIRDSGEGTPTIYPGRSIFRPMFPTREYLENLLQEHDYKNTSLSAMALFYGVASMTTCVIELREMAKVLNIPHDTVEQIYNNYPHDMLLITLEVLLHWSESVNICTIDKFDKIKTALYLTHKANCYPTVITDMVKLGISPPPSLSHSDHFDSFPNSLILGLGLYEKYQCVPPIHRDLLCKILLIPATRTDLRTLAAACGIPSIRVHSQLTPKKEAFQIFLPWFANYGPLSLKEKYLRLKFGITRMGSGSRLSTLFSNAKSEHKALISVLPCPSEHLFPFNQFEGLCPNVDTAKDTLPPWKYHFFTIVATFISTHDPLLTYCTDILNWEKQTVLDSLEKHSANKNAQIAHLVFRWSTSFANLDKGCMAKLQSLFVALNLSGTYRNLMATYGQSICRENQIATLIAQRENRENVGEITDPSGASEESGASQEEAPTPPASTSQSNSSPKDFIRIDSDSGCNDSG